MHVLLSLIHSLSHICALLIQIAPLITSHSEPSDTSCFQYLHAYRFDWTWGNHCWLAMDFQEGGRWGWSLWCRLQLIFSRQDLRKLSLMGLENIYRLQYTTLHVLCSSDRNSVRCTDFETSDIVQESTRITVFKWINNKQECFVQPPSTNVGHQALSNLSPLTPL